MRTEKINCKNCDQLFEMGFQFCPHCGQKTNDDLTIGVLFYNTISNYFSFDIQTWIVVGIYSETRETNH